MLEKIGNVLGISQAGGGFKNPSDAAMKYLNQIPGTVKPYYEPYINAGKESLASIMDQYRQLLGNPGEKFSELGKGFQQSPGYQFQYKQGMNAANQAAQAGGMAGTPYHQENAASTAENIANQDFYNYMNHIQGLYGQGLQGQENVNQMGFNSSNELANSLASLLMNQGGMAYSGVNNQNAANQAGNSNLLSLLGFGAGANANQGNQDGHGFLGNFLKNFSFR